mmetsp:Transcript_56449/g.132402  ORF Transcript_56449/g.132402 Transcript_56449/m.132402 type:complete len:361 (+) Transcript_56449:99-1181(+)
MEASKAAITPAGRDVQLFNDNLFAKLRVHDRIPDDFINTGWDFEKDFKAGGGKGGTLMAGIGESYIVKELSKGDHVTLLSVSASYTRHMCDGETLLCPIYLHFADRTTGRFFMAMRNCIGSGNNRALYDLKGCADDKTLELDGKRIPAVHKRVWNVSMWFGTSSWTPERHAYYRGKKDAAKASIPVTSEQRDQILRCVHRDTQWLEQEHLMDYSLLVAIREIDERPPSPEGESVSLASCPLVHIDNGRRMVVYASIIDFLQLWTNGKKVAMCIKVAERRKATVPPKQYGKRFHGYVADRFKATQTSTMALEDDVRPAPGSVAPPAGAVKEEQPADEKGLPQLQTTANMPVSHNRVAGADL